MQARIGSAFSTPRPIHGGSPQGSILGNFLFCMTTDWMERDINYETAIRDANGNLPQLDEEDNDTYGLRTVARRLAAEPRAGPGPPPANPDVLGIQRSGSSRRICGGPPCLLYTSPSPRD